MTIKKRLGSLLGPQGRSPQLTPGTTTQVAAGERAEVTLVKTGEVTYRVDARVPRGLDGDPSSVADLDAAAAANINTEGTATRTALNAASAQVVGNAPVWAVHADDAGYPRPDVGARPVEWWGTVEPQNMADGDVWHQFAPPFTHFEDFTAGTLTGWTPLWNATTTWTATAGTLVNTGAPSGRKALTLDAAGTVMDGEVVAKIKRVQGSAASSAGGGLVLRASGDTATASNYIASTYGNKLHISRTVNGTFFDIATAPFVVADNVYYWLRFRIVGSTLYAKIWLDGQAEPEAWTITTTDTALTAPGGIGAFASDTQVQTWDNIGVALDGATAPKGA